jgi:hypothetical protein
MSYPEFLRATLTIENSRLRIETSQRVPTDYLMSKKKLPHDVEYTLGKLIDW